MLIIAHSGRDHMKALYVQEMLEFGGVGVVSFNLQALGKMCREVTERSLQQCRRS